MMVLSVLLFLVVTVVAPICVYNSQVKPIKDQPSNFVRYAPGVEIKGKPKRIMKLCRHCLSAAYDGDVYCRKCGRKLG